MQRFFYTGTLFLVLMATSFGLRAQATCTPSDSVFNEGTVVYPLPVTEENPEGGLRDTACLNTYYETVISILVPDTAVTPLGVITIDSIVIPSQGALTNLPAGLDYTCNPGNCVFYPNTASCLVIYGTPAAGTTGVYDLGISVVIYSGTFQLPYTLPDATLAPGNYFLHVEAEDFANCADPTGISELRNENISVRVQPNPAVDATNLVVTARRNMQTEVRLFDPYGRLVRKQAVALLSGTNQYPIDLRGLPAGFYLFTLGNGPDTVSGRILVGR